MVIKYLFVILSVKKAGCRRRQRDEPDQFSLFSLNIANKVKLRDFSFLVNVECAALLQPKRLMLNENLLGNSLMFLLSIFFSQAS